uniref:Transcription factor TFIIIC triple barrel domain-containing protein n=1 Tax=Pyramimonas obovata TaxID=1411642 RepID=A0A7S0R9S3_9CHLO|mmetsp:Transcript_29133/g.63701  ORF Transcript_29133/g.63701 Transcript_29133/m.63701 type:complete len:182 (+) Transcript_29133:174-719(+)|eukprot:CAMPEP_0118936246 /NCGR_PEP_ID=MMETSP1169-20130426/17566_1 /TAXON_ID=36882 /ORGANISM="Pyramimonas obovata, Strain CCMP722" /LENGTH=181 /DNA_ID=CAMNT_0006879421 /DNA_START=140 /DNA_END=685 /DNA_ORIENTATION=-
MGETNEPTGEGEPGASHSGREEAGACEGSMEGGSSGRVTEPAGGDDGDEEEEVEYVLLDLGTELEEHDLDNYQTVKLMRLDTESPVLQFDGKVTLVGSYEETIGTCVVFEERNAEGETAAAPPTTHRETQLRTMMRKKRVSHLCNTDKILKFRRVTMVPAEAGGGAQATPLTLPANAGGST